MRFQREIRSLVLAIGIAVPPGLAAAVQPNGVPTGILHDRVVSFADLRSHTGSPADPPATLGTWRQILHEMTHASLVPPAWPDEETVTQRAHAVAASGAVPVALLDFDYARLRDPKATDGPLEIAHAFAVAPLRTFTHRGGRVEFVFDRAWTAGNVASVKALGADFDDGRGFRWVRFGAPIAVRYDQLGRKQVKVEIVRVDGSTAQGAFDFDVLHLVTATPDDTLHVVASVPYAGVQGTGDAYVYYGVGNTSLVRPVVVIEGFDLDNTFNWDEIYQLLNQQNLVETLRAEGYDTVVLNFTDATDYMQRNGWVVAKLLEQVGSAVGPTEPITVVGASMGGVLGRFALAALEQQGVSLPVRCFISFDSPQRGANIPLGIQYWMQFFAPESADAAHLDARLGTPAARQLLVYHATVPPSSVAGPDPLRSAFLADLAAVGGTPRRPRLVAVANGSGAGVDQGFAAGAQIIRYEYWSLLVAITGNVWAVTAGANQQIFHGVIDQIWPFPDRQMTVAVGGTEPYDNAPGGWRASMAEMDASQPSYGDIVALYPHHCFVPTTSALDLQVGDLFYDIDGDPALTTHTPFHAVYFPAANEEHMTITALTAASLLAEVRGVATGVASLPPGGGRVVLHPNVPNPFNPSTALEFELAGAGETELAVFDVRGRRLVTLVQAVLPGGRHRTVWDGRLASGAPAPSGVYEARLRGPGGTATRRLVLLK